MDHASPGKTALSLLTAVAVVGIGAGTAWVLMHRKASAPGVPESATTTEVAGSETGEVPSEDATPAAPTESDEPGSAGQVTAAESWNFPEPDVYLQFEWYHLDRNCPRLKPDPEPTPMLRQIALRAEFTPCFVCAKGDEERPVEEGTAIPESFQGGSGGSEASGVAEAGAEGAAGASGAPPASPNE